MESNFFLEQFFGKPASHFVNFSFSGQLNIRHFRWKLNFEDIKRLQNLFQWPINSKKIVFLADEFLF